MCLVFKTTYIDREKSLREGAFFFTRTMLFPPLDKRNTRDQVKGLCITSGRYIAGLDVRYLSALNLSREWKCHAPRKGAPRIAFLGGESAGG